MRIGLNTDSVAALSLVETLDLAAELGLDYVEFSTGNWSSAPHLDLVEARDGDAHVAREPVTRPHRVAGRDADHRHLHVRGLDDLAAFRGRATSRRCRCTSRCTDDDGHFRRGHTALMGGVR